MKVIKSGEAEATGFCPYCYLYLRLIHSDKSFWDYNNDRGECPRCEEVVVFKTLPNFHFEKST